MANTLSLKVGQTDRNGSSTSYCLLSVLSAPPSGGSGGADNRRQVSDGQQVPGPGGNRFNQFRATRNVTHTIALPMPNNVRADYGQDWTVTSTGAFEQILNTTIGNTRIGSIADAAEAAQLQIGGEFLNALTRKAMGTSARLAVQRQLGVTYDPHKEMLYGGPINRAFPLVWSFVFKNEAEAEEFDRIQQVLLEAQAPEYVDGFQTGVWKIPESFEITYVGAKGVRKPQPCVLTNVSIDYENQTGGWRETRDKHAISVSMQLNFLELYPLTKEDIRRGA